MRFLSIRYIHDSPAALVCVSENVWGVPKWIYPASGRDSRMASSREKGNCGVKPKISMGIFWVQKVSLQ
jgi:hypothetical protein